MAIIGNPFVSNVPRVMSNDELMQALRIDVINEYEAIVGYEAHVASTSDERVKKILSHIADEERRHVGELQQLISMLSPKEFENIEKGKQTITNQQAQNFNAPLQS
jgi:uncharacterized protein